MPLFQSYPADLVYRTADELQRWHSIDNGIPPTDWEHLTGFQQWRWMNKAIRKIKKGS